MRGDRSFTRHQYVLAEMFFVLAVVVVTVDLVDSLHILAHEPPDLLNNAVHHDFPVEAGELLRPMQVVEVFIVGSIIAPEICQIPVGQLPALVFSQVLSSANKSTRDLVPDPAASRVQERPHVAAIIGGDLDEMVAATQGTQ